MRKSLTSRSVPGVSRLLLLLSASLAAACSDTLDPKSVTVSGGWNMQTEFGPTDFHFNLNETADGSVSGNWSGPSRFNYHDVRGHRDGLQVTLTGDSENIFPVSLNVTFVNEKRMDGYIYYGGTTERIILRRAPREVPIE